MHELVSLLSASQTLKTVYVVWTGIERVYWVVLVASLHAFKHRAGFWCSKVVRSCSKVWAKEICKARSLRCGLSSGHFQRVGWCKENWSLNLESRHFWIEQKASAHYPGTLERMSCHKSWVSMVYSAGYNLFEFLQQTHLRVRAQVLVCVSRFLIFFDLSLPR